VVDGLWKIFGDVIVQCDLAKRSWRFEKRLKRALISSSMLAKEYEKEVVVEQLLWTVLGAR
jgi:hypothetical protein